MLTWNELLQNRHSIRDFQEKDVPADLLQEILVETCKAPSASNQQPWRFVVTHDRALMKKLSDESKKNLVNLIENDPQTSPSLRRYEKVLRDPNFNVFYNAPCLVIIGGKNTYRHFAADCAIAATYFMLAATNRGLGTCWIGLGDQIHDAQLRAAINLPADYQIVAPIIIGYPNKIPAASAREKPIILNN